MRVLFYSQDMETKEHQELISFLVNNQLAIVDKFNDLGEAEYCIEIRDYDFIILDLPNVMKKYLNLLKAIKDKDCKNCKIFLLNSKYKIDDYSFYLRNNVYMSSSNNILKELNLKDTLTYNNIDLKILGNRKISFKVNDEVIIKEFNKLEFLLMIYFIRHYGEVIHIDRLIEATLQEPEFERKTSVESSISSIKKVFKQTLDVIPIINIKKKGYVFGYQM